MDKITQSEYLDYYHIVGAAMEVHSILGRALEEPVYQEALGIEFVKRNIQAEPQKLIHCYYGDILMNKVYIADFECNGVIIEIKSVDKLIPDHLAQLFNYLRLTKRTRGLLINFGEKSLRAERYLYQSDTDDFVLLSKNNYLRYIEDNL